MVACSRARASWRAIVSRPELTLASWAIRLARSRCAGELEGAWLSTVDSESAREVSSALSVLSLLSMLSSTSGGPGGRLSRSRTLASSEKLLRVIEPLVPLLFLPLLDEDIVLLPEGNGNDPTRKSLLGHGRALYDVH